MATELATGYISLTVRYKDGMKQLNQDFTKVAKTAQTSGTKAGQQFSQGMQSGTKGITTGMQSQFKQTANAAATAGKQAGSSFTTGFKNSTKNLSANFQQSLGGSSGMKTAAEKGGMDVGSTFGKGMKAGVAGAAVAVVGSVVAVLKEATDTGIAFARQLNNMKGVTGATADQMAQVSAHAKALGSDVNLAGSSSSDAAKAMTELAKAGFTIEESMTSARGVLQLATAAQIDAAQAAEIVSTSINTFGLSAKDAQMVVDDLAAAANSSAIDIPDLALAMQSGGNAAASFGISLQDTITSLATFAQLGVKGSDAGTLMKTSLLAWQSPSEAQSGAMAELNLQLSDAQGNFVGYREMLRQLEVASKSMTQEQFNNAAATLYGTDAFRAAAMTKNGAIPIFDRIKKELEGEGQAARMAGAQMEGLPGVVEGLSNTWEGFKLAIFDVLDAPLQAIGNFVLSLTSGGGPEWFKSMGEGLRQFGALLAEHFMPAIKELWENIKGPLKDAFDQWVATLKDLWPNIKVVAAIVGVALLAAIKALGVVLPWIIKGLSGFMMLIQHVAQDAKAGWERLTNTFNFFKDIVTTVFNAVKGVIEGVWHVIEPIWTSWKEKLADVAMAVMDFWQGTMVPAWEGIKIAVSAAWDFLSGVFDKIKGGFQEVADFIKTVFNGVKGAVSAVFDGIVEAIKAPLRAVGRMLQSFPVIDLPGVDPIDVTGFGDKLAGLRRGGGIGGSGNRDTVPAMLTPGEHVLTTKDVAALGGQGGVYAFRNALHRQGGGGIPWPWPLMDPRGTEGTTGSGAPAGQGPFNPRWDNTGHWSEHALVPSGPLSPGSRYWERGPTVGPGPGGRGVWPQWKREWGVKPWLPFWKPPDQGIIGFKGGGAVTQEEIDRMGGGTINLSILKWLRGINPNAQLTSAMTDHDKDGGEHPKGKAIDIDPSSTNLKAVWGKRKSLSMIIYDDPKYVWYNMNGEEAEGAAARAIYGESTMAAHGGHIHVAALSELSGGGGGRKVKGPSLDDLTMDSTEEEIAHAILAEAERRGYSEADAKAILATAIGESGLDPSIVNSIGRTGLFQQDEGYPGRTTPAGQISGFFDRLSSTTGGKGGRKGSGDIYSNITSKVQKGGYGKDWIQQYEDQASDFASSMSDVTDANDDAVDDAADLASDQESSNPYTRIIEAVKEILPDFGAMADIAVGGVKETFLPPGFSDPMEWGVFKMASGVMGFLSTLTDDPVAKGMLQMGSAIASGSGSGVVSAIEGLIPAPFGNLQPKPGQSGPGLVPGGVGGAMGGAMGSALAGGAGQQPVGAGLGQGAVIDNSIHIAEGGQVGAKPSDVQDRAHRQQVANQNIQIGTRRMVG